MLKFKYFLRDGIGLIACVLFSVWSMGVHAGSQFCPYYQQSAPLTMMLRTAMSLCPKDEQAINQFESATGQSDQNAMDIDTYGLITAEPSLVCGHNGTVKGGSKFKLSAGELGAINLVKSCLGQETFAKNVVCSSLMVCANTDSTQGGGNSMPQNPASNIY